jgi:DNA-binding NtrC family response regulator
MPITLLIIDDDKINLTVMKEIFTQKGYKVYTTLDGEKGLSIVKKKKVDIVFTDILMPGMDGRVLIRKIKEFSSRIVVYAFSACQSVEIITQAMHSGAHDFLEKPFDIPSLIKIVDIEAKNIRRQNEHGAQSQKPLYFMGTSSQAQTIRNLKIIAASHDYNVLITGETGTGKELVAKGIHERSARKNKPFVPINCSAIPEFLIESELFGFEKGAFTGANRKFKGRFEQADGGTLFLDEIGDMPVLLQTRLLRFIQEKEILPLGQEKAIKADARIIAASNRNLLTLVGEGKFREDLYHRLHVFPIHVPPLRERTGDIRELALHFLDEINRESKKKKNFVENFISTLMRYSFPGNVRELKNIVQRSCAVSTGQLLEIPADLEAIGKSSVGTPDDEILTLDIVARNYCKEALEKGKHNIKKTAEKLGISRNTLKKFCNYSGE